MICLVDGKFKLGNSLYSTLLDRQFLKAFVVICFPTPSEVFALHRKIWCQNPGHICQNCFLSYLIIPIVSTFPVSQGDTIGPGSCFEHMGPRLPEMVGKHIMETVARFSLHSYFCYIKTYNRRHRDSFLL